MHYGQHNAAYSDSAAKQASIEHASRQQNIGAALGASTPREMSQMEQAMNGTSNAIHELASCLDVLEQRLQPVMRPVPPTAEGKGPQGVDIAHSVAVDQMHIQRRQVDNLIRRVHEITDRLET